MIFLKLFCVFYSRSRKYLLGRKASVISNPASETAFVYSNGLFASHFKDPLASTKDYPMHEINTISSHVEKKSSAPSAQPLGMYLRSIVERDTDRYQVYFLNFSFLLQVCFQIIGSLVSQLQDARN